MSALILQRRRSAKEARQRKRAAALKAPRAFDVVERARPGVAAALTAAQLAQLQRVLDAAVLNPVIDKEADAIFASSYRGGQGAVVIRDSAKVAKADRHRATKIAVDASDRRVRLNLDGLLDPRALAPTTDNPDEAKYLESVRKTLESRGIWLQLSEALVHPPDDPSSWVVDPRIWEVWVTLGSGGSGVPLKSAPITRDVLLKTGVLGAGYYRNVHQGPVQQALQKEVNRLLVEIEAGTDWHNDLAKLRRKTIFGVVEVSDFIGRADFPSTRIWDRPHQLVVRSMTLNNAGNTEGAKAFLLAASIETANASNKVARYLAATTKGAGYAVAGLEVARKAGEIAGTVLLVTGVGGAVLKAGARAGAGAAVRSGASGRAGEQATAEAYLKWYSSKNPGLAGDLGKVKLMPGPKGTVLGGRKAGTSSGAGTGFHKW